MITSLGLYLTLSSCLTADMVFLQLLFSGLALANSHLQTVLASTSDSDSHATRCNSLHEAASSIIPSYHEVYSTQVYPDGTNFSTPYASLSYNSPVPNLPAFCRFGAFFNTTSRSRVQFEVWLPLDGWNQRFAFIGNGGDAGGVNYPDMGIPMAKYGLAVASTDTGHNGTGADGTFAINNPESQIDFGHRAVHLSTVYSKKIVRAFYGGSARKNYWIGCSSGGKQGLKELQAYPDDFDGVIAGSPAYWWSHLNGWTVQSNLLNEPSMEGYVDVAAWTNIHTSIMAQCDGLDGLVDGMITNPAICKPDFTQMNLTKAQIPVAESIYTNWTDAQGNFLFPAFSYGAEWAPYAFILGTPYEPGPDYFKYQVLNFTSVNNNYTFTQSALLDFVKTADATDPGQTTALDGDITPFIQRGGKFIGFVGTADQLIPYGSSIYYHEHVRATLGHDPRDSYRLFTVPGMGHCSGGIAPWNFGGPGQRDISLGGSGQSAVFNASYDMILSLLAWTENGTAPDYIIGTSYNDDNKTLGVEFERRLCPYPLMAKYNGGNANSSSSFSCE